MDLTARPRTLPNVLGQRVADRLVLLNPDTGAYYSLEDVGVRVWELCDGSRTVAEAVSVICAEYDADAAMVEGDVLRLLTDLSRERLIDEVGR